MAYRIALALLVLAAAAACTSTGSRNSAYTRDGYVESASSGASKPPAMERTRKIAAQDCSKPVAFDEGNLRCK
jgi:hypothetical protein